MDTMLLAVTVVSLLVAAISASIAWQVTRAERQRRAARVAGLAAAAGIRAQAPASDVYAPTAAHPGDTAAWDVPSLTGDRPIVGDRLFARDVPSSGGATRQQWLMGSAVLIGAACLALALTWVVAGRTAAPRNAGAPAPLELVALAHNRTDGLLAVSGLVRNPQSGARVEKLEAEVRVFDATGILIANRSAQIDYLELSPGQESAFVVTVGEAATAARYRVSFRAAGAMRPHVDRRTNLPAQIHQTAEARR